MRVTSSMYYDNIYSTNNGKLSKQLFDVNRQIASESKIQYAHENVGAYTETMRLDNEVTILGQVKKSTESAFKVSNQSDVVLNEFTDGMERMRKLLLQASNSGVSDEISLDAISAELRGIEKNLMSLANTSINGQYLFSGSAVDIKPISDDGTYNGNDIGMNAFLGNNTHQQYNITGSELFLGEEILNKREVTTNVVNKNLLDDTGTLSAKNTIREMMGDADNDATTANTNYFYIRGTKSDGETFKQKIDDIPDTQSIQTLLDRIGEAYGNTGSLQVVNVSMNDSGQIVVEDKQKGSSKLDFHMVGAVDYTAGAGGLADVANIDDLGINGGETNYPPTGDLFVKEFMKSGLTSAPDASIANTIEGSLYDRVAFKADGLKLSSNVPQVLKASNTSSTPATILQKNAFATDSTKISDVADLKTEILPATSPKSYTLDGTEFKLEGTNINGAAYDISINLDAAGSTFTDNTTGINYDIYDMDSAGRKQVPADEMTYRQMMDVINMAVTDSVPALNFADADAYDAAVESSVVSGETYLSYDGKIEFRNLQAGSSQASISLYDSVSDDFSAGAGASAMTFNANNSLTVTDPKTDVFKSINEIITAVEEYKFNADAGSGSQRNIGIQNSIAKLDGLMDHVNRSHTVVGAHSNTLTTSLERTEILKISTEMLRSSVIDTDLAEASLRLTQLSLNYEAMLSTVGRVSKLSLVNYL